MLWSSLGNRWCSTLSYNKGQSVETANQCPATTHDTNGVQRLNGNVWTLLWYSLGPPLSLSRLPFVSRSPFLTPSEGGVHGPIVHRGTNRGDRLLFQRSCMRFSFKDELTDEMDEMWTGGNQVVFVVGLQATRSS